MPRSFRTILTVMFVVVVRVVAILSSSGTVMWWFLRNLRNPTGTVLRGREAEGDARQRTFVAGRDRLFCAWRELFASRDRLLPFAWRRRRLWPRKAKTPPTRTPTGGL